MENNTKYSRRVIEIADYILANPVARRMDVLAKFGKHWQMPNRTLDRLWKQAKEYNIPRVQKSEKKKDDLLISETTDEFRNIIKSREWYLAELQKDFESLGNRKPGNVFKTVDNETGQVIGYMQAGYNDEVQAKNARGNIYAKIANAMGWEAPTKIEAKVQSASLVINVMDENTIKEIQKLSQQ